MLKNIAQHAGRAYGATFRREFSRGKFSLSELKSGLQKAVRRGDATLALRCARELMTFREAPGDDKDRRRIRTNILHRLMVIFLEDVGQEDLWPEVEDLRVAFMAAPAWPSDDTVYRWVALMAAAPKTRRCSHARSVAYGCLGVLAAQQYPGIAQLGEHLSEVPTAVEVRAAIVMKSKIAIVLAWRLANVGPPQKTAYGRKPMWAVYEALMVTAIGYEVEEARRAVAWGKELQTVKEGFLCWMLPLLARLDEEAPDVTVDGVQDVLDAFDPAAPLVLPAYVFDMHVSGKKDYVRFALEGSRVENEDAARVNPTWKAFYEDLKFVAAGEQPLGPCGRPAKLAARAAARAGGGSAAEPAAPPGGRDCETAQYELVVRAQLTTSAHKTDVYFARELATGDLVVVKGPFVREGDVARAVAMAAWKTKHGLPATAPRLVWLVPDRWPAGVPLGVRGRLPRDRPAPFLVAPALVDGPPPAKTHRSKLWPPTEVADWDRLAKHCWRPAKNFHTRQEKLDWVIALLFRYVMGLGDLADRNFFCAGGRLFSLDEDAQPREVRLGPELRKTKAGLAAGWLGEMWAEVAAALARWEVGPGPERRRLEAIRASREAALALFAT